MSGHITIDKRLDNLLAKTLWIWVPFYALFHLVQEIVDQKHNGKPNGH
jgi:hypothetical protein